MSKQPLYPHITKGQALLAEINRSKLEITKAVQAIYDSWEQDEQGLDVELGAGGICDQVANTIGEIFSMKGYEVVDGGQPGDEHAYPIIHDNQKAYVVDIPCRVYEYGGGYNWTKRTGITVQQGDIIVYEVNLKDIIEQE